MEAARPTQMQNRCEREGRLPETQMASIANENLIGNPQQLYTGSCKKNSAVHRALLFLGEDHGAQHLLAWPLI